MPSPLSPTLSPITIPASWLYRSAIFARNRAYDQGWRVQQLDRPVISVGNITAGGTGKTPMVMHIARLLLDAGRRPVIAMRGYGAQAGEPSDEQLEYEQRLPDVPVLANPDRTSTLRAYLTQHDDCDCAILDDGFQHRRLHRDLDLVLIDAAADTFNDRLLPAGLLREPLRNLARADAVIVTRAASRDADLSDAIEYYHRRPPIAWSRHTWRHLNIFERGRMRQEPVDWVKGKRLLTMIGTGHPQAVAHQFAGAGAQVCSSVPTRDHDRYSPATLNAARRMMVGLDAIAITWKDWVKISHREDVARWPVPVVIPELVIDVFAGAEALASCVTGIVAPGGSARVTNAPAE